jgi:5,10-methylenetetrahydromethanopterin reductase
MSYFESIGVGFGDYESYEEFLNLAKFVEKLDFSGLWIQEGYRMSSLTLAALALHSTARLRVGVGVTSPFRRHPQILAIEAATLDKMSNGRFILGLGAALGAIRSYGLKTMPRQGMEDAFRIIRGLLSNDPSEFSYEGKVFSLRASQKRLMTDRVPIYMGAIGPRMLDLAGQVADGLIMSRRGSFSLEYTKYSIQEVVKSAKRHKRNPEKLNFLGFFETCISEDEDSARQFAKRILGTYTIPELPSLVSRLAGINEEEIAAVKQSYLKGDLNGAISAVTDELVDKLCLAGTSSQCVEKLAKFAGTGVMTPILYIHGPDVRIAAKLAAERIVPELTGK